MNAAGMALVDADDAVDLSTAFVVGFIIEEQERRQSSKEDPTRYSLAGRDAWLGEEFLMVREAGHARDDGDSRFERQLGIVLDGIAAREAWAHTGPQSRRRRAGLSYSSSRVIGDGRRR